MCVTCRVHVGRTTCICCSVPCPITPSPSRLFGHVTWSRPVSGQGSRWSPPSSWTLSLTTDTSWTWSPRQRFPSRLVSLMCCLPGTCIFSFYSSCIYIMYFYINFFLFLICFCFAMATWCLVCLCLQEWTRGSHSSKRRRKLFRKMKYSDTDMTESEVSGRSFIQDFRLAGGNFLKHRRNTLLPTFQM